MSEHLTSNPPLSATWYANEFLAWADSPAQSGYVPVHPETLRKVAKILRELDRSSKGVGDTNTCVERQVSARTAEKHEASDGDRTCPADSPRAAVEPPPQTSNQSALMGWMQTAQEDVRRGRIPPFSVVKQMLDEIERLQREVERLRALERLRAAPDAADIEQLASYYEHGADVDTEIAGELAQRDARLLGKALRALQRERTADEPKATDEGVADARRWIAYLESEPQHEPDISIARVLRDLVQFYEWALPQITNRTAEPPAAIPPSTQSKSDAQIAAELQTNMDAMIEPTDERERQCYRRLIRIMARARNRLQQIADAQSTAEPPSASDEFPADCDVIDITCDEDDERVIEFAFVRDDILVELCEDCPPANYPTNETRCDECPRRPHETSDGQPWKCTICNNQNPDDATHCRQCEYSRTVMRDGQRVPRDGRL